MPLIFSRSQEVRSTGWKTMWLSRKSFLSTLFLGLNLSPLLAQDEHRYPDVTFVPTPQEVVRAMLEMAEVGPDDVVYDLGCGDGRFVITAAKEFGARGVGIDIDPERISESKRNARAADVADRVTFRRGDLFEADISEATVVALYLLQTLNFKLQPKLLRELNPGARVVSYTFDMPDWKPEKQATINGIHNIYLWTIPPERVMPGTKGGF